MIGSKIERSKNWVNDARELNEVPLNLRELLFQNQSFVLYFLVRVHSDKTSISKINLLNLVLMHCWVFCADHTGLVSKLPSLKFIGGTTLECTKIFVEISFFISMNIIRWITKYSRKLLLWSAIELLTSSDL